MTRVIPLAVELANTKTHDNVFTRAYWLGYAKATASYWRGAFLTRIPESMLEDLGQALEGRTLVVRHQEQSGPYGVSFLCVHVSPAEVLDTPDNQLVTAAT